MMRLVFSLPPRGSSALYKPEYFYGRGLGGGECALYLLTHQLAKMGHQVEVYNPVSNGEEYEGVYHYNLADLDPTEYCDAFILFRSPNHIVRDEINTPVRLFWSIDQYTEGNYKTDIFPFVDYTVTISPYHMKYHIGRYSADPEKINHIDLGVNLEDYQQDIEKVPGRLLYSSVEVRGLWHLPQLYQLIKEARPEASLVVTADYTLWGATFTGLERAPERFGHLDDVEILGAVPRKDLVRHQLEADILAYPCTYEELFCLAVAEAQVAGAVPVTTDIGAIRTTLDTGHAIPLRPGMPQYEQAFVGHITRLLSDRAELEKLQKEARQKARKRFDYGRIGQEWITLIEKLQKGRAIEMTKKKCEWPDGCGRDFKGKDKYCWQHEKAMQKQAAESIERSKDLAPTDLTNRIPKRERIVHLCCHEHKNILEVQLSQMPNVECFPMNDPGPVDEDTTIVLLDVLNFWTFKQASESISLWLEAGATIVAFLPLNLQEYELLGQARSWTQQELEALGFEVEVLEGFHILPEGLVDACWAIQ